MLHIDYTAKLEQIESSLQEAQRWWNGQQANPKYRHRANDALARLREARSVLLDPVRRQTYDRQRQAQSQNWREVRWQPVRELLDILLENNRCSYAQQQLIIRFAQRRNLSDEEISILLNEEFLRREIDVMPPPNLNPAPQNTLTTSRIGYYITMVLMSVAFLGIIGLSLFYSLHRAAILLTFPLLNDLRLLVRGMILSPNTQKKDDSSTNAWDWIVGFAVLGGATAASILDIEHHAAFPLGLTIAALIWLAWLILVLLWHQSHHPKHTKHTTEENKESQ